MATRGKKVEIYYTSQGTTTGIDASALVFDGKNLNIYTHNKTFKGTDTTYDVFGPSGSNASSGLVPAPSSTAGSSKFLREDATWADLNLVNPYVGPTNDLDASVGYINATPGVGQTNKFFRSDGTWVSITKSTVGLNNVDNTSDASKTVAAAGKATNLAAGAAGSIPYQSASNTTAFLAAGSNGQVLAYDSANNKPYWKDDNNTWKAANASQEGYVPKTTANKILRSNNDGTPYWGDDTNTWRPVGTGADDAAAGNHTHGISIATDSGTNQITLAHGTKYKLTAGGQSYIFTTPSDNNTDTKVSQVNNDDNAARPILVKYGTGTDTVTNSALFADGVTVNPSNNSLSISGNLSVTGTASFSNNVTFSGNISNSNDSHGLYFFNNCGIEKWAGYGPSLVAESGTDFEISSRTDRATRYKIIHTGNISSQSVSSATTCSYPAGFTSRGTSDWSGVSGTFATDWSVNGADIMFKYDGSKLNVITDGRFYQGIDIYGASKRVLDEYDISHTKWGDADTVDSEHSSAFAHRQYWNDMVHSGNEYTWIRGGYSGGVWINYRTASGSCDGNITQYIFGNGKGGSLASITSGTFNGNCTGSAGSVAWSNVSGRPTDLSSFSNGPGYITSGGSCAFASNTSFSRQYSKSGAGYIDTDISVNVYSGRCMLVLYTAHGGGGSTCGSRVYMLRCGSSDSYISVTTIATNTANDGLYSPSFSSNNGLLRIYNPYANGSFLVLFTNWV